MTNNQQPTTNKKYKVGEIVGRNAPVLREIAESVPIKDIPSKKIQDILKLMKKALREEEDGVAIAAPQIGESLRIFVVSGKVFVLGKEELAKEDEEKIIIPDDLVFINPEIVKLSRKKIEMEEGCLSARWLYGWVKRSEKATVRAYNEKGERFEMGGSGLMAQIFQHETDHLVGVLFLDKAKDINELPPPSNNNNEKK